MRKLLFISIILYQWSYGQVGINTTIPTKELDVNGELRVRNLPEENSSITLLTSDSDGNIAKITNAKLLKEIYTDEASSPVDYYMYSTSYITVDNINLGLENVVVIPANTKATLIVSYSVPMGNTYRTQQVNGYFGIRFLKNGVEAPQGSRKFSVPNTYRDGTNQYYEVVDMVSVGTTYLEVIDNSTNGNSLTVTYSLNGYIEQAYSSTNVTYRFNMWSSYGDNYNWGKGYISTQMYIHQ